MTSRAGNAIPHLALLRSGEGEECTSPTTLLWRMEVPLPGEGFRVSLVHIIMQKFIVTQQIIVIIQIVFGNESF